MKRSYYSNTISKFLTDTRSNILGLLSINHSHSLEDLQKNAWLRQIEILQENLDKNLNAKIYFEFGIPRMGKRVDNVIILNDLILVIEFKVGESKYPNHAIEQVIDYSIDLQNFHEGSHNKKIIPILISTKANAVNFNLEIKDNIYSPVKLNQSNLSTFINHLQNLEVGEKINFEDWEKSIYKPTPTIVEAAQALYKGHNVEEISRSDAGAINLSKTAYCLNEIIEKTKVSNTKSICFVTDVPSAGKTLAGLNIAKKWLLEQRRGSERMGIVASSGARRLRALGIDVKNEIIPTNWFLNRDEDVRSSYFLEVVATEFDIQGLEVDWICLAWGGNLHLDTNKEWTYKAFKGTKWQDIKKDVNRKYLLNSYRVLLTRARQGMIIFIPKGNNLDQTRKNEYYDYTFNYLKKIGINEIETS